jgi:hypothetical protein
VAAFSSFGFAFGTAVEISNQRQAPRARRNKHQAGADVADNFFNFHLVRS